MAAKETTVSVAPMHSIFAQKKSNIGDNRAENMCVGLDKLCFFSFFWSKVKWYFHYFESYENIKYTVSHFDLPS